MYLFWIIIIVDVVVVVVVVIVTSVGQSKWCLSIKQKDKV